MSTKQELENELASFKQIAATRLHDLNLVRNAKWSVECELSAVKRDRDYFKTQLGESSQAWAKKYMEAQDAFDSTAKLMTEVSVQAITTLKNQAAQERQGLIHAGQLAIEQARTDVMADVFDRTLQSALKSGKTG